MPDQNAVLLESKVNNDCKIGPFAYLRPGTVLEECVKIGDFVEVKNQLSAKVAKSPPFLHRDAFVGQKVNGCGTITCNYDGKNKHVTRIEDGAFIGSNTNLVAPVTVGKNAFIGAGSTINKDVPENSLYSQGKQKNILDWVKAHKE